MLSREEKERILETLERDREFRYALMGLLGFKELLDRFTRLEERQHKLEERQQKLEERQHRLELRQQRLEERQQRLEERQQKLEERMIKLEQRQQRLEERQQRLEERMIKLEERQQKLEERIAGVERELCENRRLLLVIAHRYGILTEAGFRESMKYVVEEVLGVGEVRRWVYKDEEGSVYGYASIVEVDVLIRDREHILLEIKSRVSKGDVSELYRKGLLYEKVNGIKPRLAVVGGLIDRDAYEAAKELNVEVKPIIKEEYYLE